MPTFIIHFVTDLILIGLIFVFDKELKRNKNTFLFISSAVFGSNIIDVDHLWYRPIYDPMRCSINYFPFHSWYLFPVWVIGLLVKNKFVKYFCLGVALHLWLDWIDCMIISAPWWF